jgi:hypothetical protein
MASGNMLEYIESNNPKKKGSIATILSPCGINKFA